VWCCISVLSQVDRLASKGQAAMSTSQHQVETSSDISTLREQGVSFNGGFVPRQQLAELLYRGLLRKVSRGVVVAGRQQFALHEAVRVRAAIGVSLRGGEANHLIGFVERVARLEGRGITLTADAMLLGDHAYAIERGVIAETITDSAA